MKNLFLTLDLEEWYHLEYLKDYDCDKGVSVVDGLAPFLSMVDGLGIHMTVFVVSELIPRHSALIREIASLGHEIATHGPDHGLVSRQSLEEFVEGATRAKSDLEDLLGARVRGYRAPCYSLDDAKLARLPELGFDYDSSFIRFSQHPLYNVMGLDGFEPVADLVYQREGFFEFEVPTFPILGKMIPISGGGYFRLFPATIYRALVHRYSMHHRNFLLYIHPFEVSHVKVRLPRSMRLGDRFRYSVGQREALPKLEQTLAEFKEQGVEFWRLGDYVDRMRERQ